MLVLHPPRGKAVTKMRMTRKSPKSFLDAKSCVESVSEVFFEVPARPDESVTLLLQAGFAILFLRLCALFRATGRVLRVS